MSPGWPLSAASSSSPEDEAKAGWRDALGGEEIGLADEIGDEARRGPLVDFRGRTDLQDPAATHHRDPVGHGQRLVLVVRHEDEGDAELALQPLQLELHLGSQLEVERRERLVEQQDARLVGEGAGEGDALLLTAGKLCRLAVLEPVELHESEHLGDLRRDLRALAAAHLETEGDVLRDRQMREDGIALEHGVDRPAERRQPIELLAMQQDRAGILRLETGDEAQHRGLAAAARAEQREELVRTDCNRDAVERADAAGEDLDEVATGDGDGVGGARSSPGCRNVAPGSDGRRFSHRAVLRPDCSPSCASPSLGWRRIAAARSRLV